MLVRRLGRVYDAASVTLFAAMTVQPLQARKAPIDDLVKRLKATGIWAKLDLLHVYAAHTEQAALLNWKSPGTFDGTSVSGMLFTADQGFTGDASADYIDTGWVANTNGVNYTQNAASFGAWSRTAGTGAGIDLGLATQGAARVLFRNASNQISAGRINDATNSLMASSITDGSGLTAVERPSSATKHVYKNGAVGSDVSVASTGRPATAFHVGGEGGSGTSSRQFAMFFAGGALGAAGQLTFYSAVQAYMQAIGAA